MINMCQQRLVFFIKSTKVSLIGNDQIYILQISEFLSLARVASHQPLLQALAYFFFGHHCEYIPFPCPFFSPSIKYHHHHTFM